MLRPPRHLPTEAEIRALERDEASRLGIDLFVLMQRAAAALDAYLHVHWPEARRILVVCGPGNNGGDGFALALRLRARGLEPVVWATSAQSGPVEARRARAEWMEAGGRVVVLKVSPDTQESGSPGEPVDADTHRSGPGSGGSGEGSGDIHLSGAAEGAGSFRQAGLESSPEKSDTHQSAEKSDYWKSVAHAPVAGAPRGPECFDLVVDAVLGIGVTRSPEGAVREAILRINQAGVPVLSVDLPSGVIADTGGCPGVAVRASRTLALVAAKRGLFVGSGRDFAGFVALDDLGLAGSFSPESDSCRLLGPEDLGPWGALRPRSAHKGDFGRAQIIGGAPGMAGAALLAAGAARSAAPGYVLLSGGSDVVGPSLVRHPEVMVTADWAQTEIWMSQASAIAIGPGLGQDDWARRRFDAALARVDAGLVLDADALNLLAQHPRTLSPRVVLTPHPGEAARLLSRKTHEIQSDRIAAARELARRYEAVVVLKGAGTVLAHPDGRIAVCAAGNPGMARAGMGDVLCGLIAGLLAQHRDAWAAACAGTWWHANVADRIARCQGERAVTPSAVLDALMESDSWTP